MSIATRDDGIERAAPQRTRPSSKRRSAQSPSQLITRMLAGSVPEVRER
jgi:hypothetical protein